MQNHIHIATLEIVNIKKAVIITKSLLTVDVRWVSIIQKYTLCLGAISLPNIPIGRGELLVL